MTASRLRMILIAAIVGLIGISGAGFWWLHGFLSQKVHETDHVRIDAEVSDIEVTQLKQLDQQLDQQKDIIERTTKIAADATGYQAQVITDITAYAQRYGIEVSSFEFAAAGTGGAKTAESVQGAHKVPFIVNLKGPLNYITFLKFLRDIENNLTKMQLTSLTLSPDRDPANIATPSLNLEVYVKN